METGYVGPEDMTLLIVIGFIVFRLVFALIVGGIMHRRREIGPGWAAFWVLIFGWFIAIIIIAIVCRRRPRIVINNYINK